jgi:hypothetical protein
MYLFVLQIKIRLLPLCLVVCCLLTGSRVAAQNKYLLQYRPVDSTADLSLLGLQKEFSGKSACSEYIFSTAATPAEKRFHGSIGR